MGTTEKTRARLSKRRGSLEGVGRVKSLDHSPWKPSCSVRFTAIPHFVRACPRARGIIVIEKWKPDPVRIVGPLKSRVNQLAHRLALAYELERRAAILGLLNDASAQGKRSPELHALLDELEAQAQ